jgi:hypothetical protein
MSRICLYADEDAAETAIVNALASAGYDVLTAQKAGTEGDGDLQQLEFASSQRRTVYTLNTSDFAILHAKFMTTGRHHAGIITMPGQRYGIGEKLRRLLAFLENTDAEDRVDHIVYL